jgi:hypothetical protein
MKRGGGRELAAPFLFVVQVLRLESSSCIRLHEAKSKISDLSPKCTQGDVV